MRFFSSTSLSKENKSWDFLKNLVSFVLLKR